MMFSVVFFRRVKRDGIPNSLQNFSLNLVSLLREVPIKFRFHMTIVLENTIQELHEGLNY